MPLNPAQDPARWDIGNPFRAPLPCALNAFVVTEPETGVQHCITTIRDPANTSTHWLTKAEAETWRDTLDECISHMTSLVLPRPGAAPGNGGRP